MILGRNVCSHERGYAALYGEADQQVVRNGESKSGSIG